MGFYLSSGMKAERICVFKWALVVVLLDFYAVIGIDRIGLSGLSVCGVKHITIEMEQ